MARTKEELIEENVNLARDWEDAGEVLFDDDLSDEDKVESLRDYFESEEDEDEGEDE